MNIYIDTEFNDFKGDLISIGLVAEDGNEFYEVLRCDNPSFWVEENVMPILDKDPEPIGVVQSELTKFLNQYDSINIISDWPEDIKHFCDLLITGPGTRIRCPKLTFECRWDLSSCESEVPHNALHDARAIAKDNKIPLVIKNR
jgi:hypothetical protein